MTGTRYRLAMMMVTALALAGAAASAAESDPEIALQRALDQPVTLSLQNVSLAEAFKQIAATAKISLQVDPRCYELLPYGDTTRVSVDFRQSKLREGLDVLLFPLGLQTTIAGNAVMIQPSNPLKHIGRRADWEELKLLGELAKNADVKAPTGGRFDLTEGIKMAMEGRKDLRAVWPAHQHRVVRGGRASGGRPHGRQDHDHDAPAMDRAAVRAADSVVTEG
jgi:hypothetical protein